MLKSSTNCGRVTYVIQGLVAFGLIPSNATDSVGDTIGGIGSAITLQRGSFSKKSGGTFTGTLVVQPDRGFNMYVQCDSVCVHLCAERHLYRDGTIDYQARQHFIDFTLTPYYGDSNLTFDTALETLQLTYRKTILYFERDDQKTTGLDSPQVRPREGLPFLATSDPVMPIPSSTFNHLSIDAEGLALNADGT